MFAKFFERFLGLADCRPKDGRTPHTNEVTLVSGGMTHRRTWIRFVVRAASAQPPKVF
jgi:hypothetical protein